MSEIYTDPPQSRNEAIIKATIDGTEYTAPPQSRMEDLLLELKEVIEQGGGGGTSDYSQLRNKPSINDVTLSGNKTSSDLGLMPEYEVDTTPTEDSENLITSGGVWNADKNINNKLQGSKQASSTSGTIEIPDYGMTESIDMYFKPTQDLHGYDKPWAGGAGKNKFGAPYKGTSGTETGITTTVNSDGSVRFQGTSQGDFYWNFKDGDVTLPLDAGTYTISSADEIPQGMTIYVQNTYLNVANQSQTLTFPEASSLVCYVHIPQTGISIDFTAKIQLEQGSTATAFEPYSNICPISGQDNATFEWTGKNKFGGTYDEFFPLHFNTDTVVVASCDEISGDTPQIAFYDENENQLDYWGMSTEYSAVTGRMARSFTLPKEAYFVKFINAEAQDYQIEIASVNTSYQRYIHEERTMNFGNTYYGGFCQFDGQIYPDWDYITSYNGETLSGEWVSDRDEYVAGTTPTIGAEVAYKTTPTYVKVTPPANLNLTDDYPIEYNGYMANISYQPKNTVLAEAKRYTNQEIAKLGLPTPPTTDGTYHLECSVSGGIPTITWVSNS